MRTGADFRSFAGHCEVSEPTLYNWRKTHKSFDEAFSIAIELCYKWWETQSRKPYSAKDRMDTAMFIINMRNRFKWTGKDKDDPPPKDDDAFSENYMTWEKRKSER
jgi:hypothetical protein